mmetsp:Transcript_11578/g.20848  ORF Transcript_11578/g.20848 Transcript_11578/m.20848 type:complete len:225 (+) Transcript_11578:184-858(+)
MNRALMILATSYATIQTCHSIAPSVSVASTGCGYGFRDRKFDRRSFDSVIMTLRHPSRDGADQSLDIRTANYGSATQDDQVSTCDNRSLPVPIRIWMLPVRLLSPSAATQAIDERQVAVEEYLEYIERRYHRMEQGSIGTRRPGFGLDIPGTEKKITNVSYLNSRGGISEFLCSTFRRLNAAFVSSLRITTLRLIIIDEVGFSVASLAILFVCCPILKMVSWQG